MGFHYADALEEHNWVGGGLDAYIYYVTPTIVVKTVRRDRTPEEKAAEHPFLKEIAFYRRLMSVWIGVRILWNVFSYFRTVFFYYIARIRQSLLASMNVRSEGQERMVFTGVLSGSRNTRIMLLLLGGYSKSPLLLSIWRKWASTTMICMQVTVFLTGTST